MPDHRTRAADRQGVPGAVYALGAYLFWGFSPLFWRALDRVGAAEILGHRVVWSVVFVGALLALQGRLGEVAPLLRDRVRLLPLLASTALIGSNWLVFLWAVNSERVLETSLGYFITPLVQVALGVAILRERLSRAQALAVGIAGVGVAFLVVSAGQPPWVSLSLAGTFSLYGLVRKVAPVDSLLGLSVETLLLAPLASVGLAALAVGGGGAFGAADPGFSLLLACAGPATAIPLLLFAGAARRLRYATVGLFQYLAPSIQLLLATLLWREPFTGAHAVAFGCVWTALALSSLDTLLRAPGAAGGR